MKRTRDRRNKHGRRGPGNRCGHDRRRPIRPEVKGSLPNLLRIAAERLARLALPQVESELPFRFPASPRSERAEAVRAVGAVMLARTDILSGRVGRPRAGAPRHFDGLTVDHDLAPLSQISESRTERVIATFADWGWLHYREVSAGRRASSDGKLRLPSQPIERTPDGFRGMAAIRVWTPAFWAALGLTAALAEAQLARGREEQKARAIGPAPLRSLVRALADAHSSPPDPDPRPP